MRIRTVIFLITMILVTAGCGTSAWKNFDPFYGKDETAVTQTQAGGIKVEKNNKGTVTITVAQPSNPDEAASLIIQMPDQTQVTASTGSSREDKHAGFLVKMGQYKTFSYVGAVVCVIGIALFAASFWIPLIPKMAGPLVFAGGALTAYMSTAIPQYGPYFLVLSLIGAVAWYYHHTAGKKDPETLKRKPKILSSQNNIQ